MSSSLVRGLLFASLVALCACPSSNTTPVPCPSGQAPDGTGQCRTTCSTSNPCAPGSACAADGFCVPAPCPLGQALNANNQCAYICSGTVACATGTSCSPDGFCDPAACPPGQAPSPEGICLATCSPSVPCSGNASCSPDGFCVANPCPAGQALSPAGSCLTTCSATTPCAAGMYCSVDGYCFPSPPTVTSTVPTANATRVSRLSSVSATFSVAMDPATLTPSSFSVDGVSGTVTYAPSTKTATFTPDAPFANGVPYTARVSTAAADPSGNALATDYVWSFTTGDCTPTNPSADPSSRFGAEVRTLSNGNIVITDPLLTVNGVPNAGAVYLFDGKTCALISTLTGDSPNEAVGGGGIGVLKTGNFVVFSNFGATDSGFPGAAATFVNGTTGLNGTVSASNSLVQTPSDGGSQLTACVPGQPAMSMVACQQLLQRVATFDPGSSALAAAGSAFDQGLPPVPNEELNFVPLASGGYLLLNPGSGPGGAVTFGDGTTGVSGPVSPANSLVGNPGDLVGAPGAPFSTFRSVTVLSKGNYVVSSGDSGFVTWGNESGGTTGVVSAANSLATGAPYPTVTALGNGNYVVSGAWGAVLEPGDGGVAGPPVNFFTTGTVVALTNGNYVIANSSFDAGVGAVTLGDGTRGLVGSPTPTNSLLGLQKGDRVGTAVRALAGGAFVVLSPFYDGGMGAATFVPDSGLVGYVTPANSLVGAQFGDRVGSGSAFGLSNGNYVVCSPSFDGGIGAATFGAGPLSGGISFANSLVGSLPGDQVCSGGVTALTNGNYVVVSPFWSGDAGSVTFGNGATGTNGVVSAANSLVGSSPGDLVGGGFSIDEVYLATFHPANGTGVDGFRRTARTGVVALNRNGNYVVMSPAFGGGIGAATWGSGTTGAAGTVNATNSLLGSQPGDHVSGGGVFALANGNYVVLSPLWSNGGAFAAGAATFGLGDGGTAGVVSATNSLVGAASGDLVGFTGLNFSAGVPGEPNLSSQTAFQDLFNTGGGSGNGAMDWAAEGVGPATDLLPGQIKALSNGNYVVPSPYFDNERGAVTVGSATVGVSGVVSASNSLLGPGPRSYFGAQIEDDGPAACFAVSGLAELYSSSPGAETVSNVP